MLDRLSASENTLRCFPKLKLISNGGKNLMFLPPYPLFLPNILA